MDTPKCSANYGYTDDYLNINMFVNSNRTWSYFQELVCCSIKLYNIFSARTISQ